MTRTVGENCARRSNERQLNCRGVSIANRLAMKMRRWFDPVCLIQQLANRDLRFARVVFPFGDGVRDAIVEANQAVPHGAEGGDPPEALRAAKNLATQIGRSAIG